MHQSEGSCQASEIAGGSGRPDGGGAPSQPKQRIRYLDTLRVIAIAFVLVNHTVGPWMLSLPDQTMNWWFGVTYFFMCKFAVPLFVMISGALLLRKTDPYQKTGRRIVRIAKALVLFSVFYYFVNQTSYSLIDFVDRFWHAGICAPLWYLYMYLGLLIMLPLLQRLASVMRNRDYLYFFAISLGIVNLLPVVAAFSPSFEPTSYFQLPMFTGFVGMFFGGHYLANVAKVTRRHAVIAAVVFLVCLAFLVASTDYFYQVNGGKGYLAMDNRTFSPIMLMAACVFVVVRWREDARAGRPARSAAQHVIRELALCSFGIYLVHPYFVTLMKPYFVQAAASAPDVFALLVYQLVLFAVSFAATWLLRLIPPVRDIL